MTQNQRTIDQQVRDLNCVIRYLSRRDLDDLTPEALKRRRGTRQADLLILMGGITTPDFVEKAAGAFREGLAKGLMVVGGVGHSTQNLRDNVAFHPVYGSIPTSGRAEADILCDILVKHLGITRNEILIERQSTNCGNNATFALEVVRQAAVPHDSVVIVQDPIMQRRTLESFRHEWRTEKTAFDAFAPVIPLLAVRSGEVGFADPGHAGYYNMDRFLALVMGEIPRLRDDEKGYGPAGSGFIGHVDIPPEVEAAFSRLIPLYKEYIRPKCQP
ncbi:YdcF family protein [bacterium]|nr:YdcF family protein [bacterium]